MPNFDAIEKLTRGMRKLNTWLDSGALLDRIVEINAVKIAGLNVSQMFDYGQTATGAMIKPDYAPSTIARKKRKHQPYNRVTLRDTREFHDEMIATPEHTQFTIDSPVEHTQYLTKRYGDEIFGLNDGNREMLIQGIAEAIKRIIPLLRYG